jgi:hypothetical protein
MTITLESLKKALHLQESIEKLQAELRSVLGQAGAKVLGVVEGGMKLATKGIQGITVKRKKGKMSAAGRAAIVAAQKKRWAKVKKGKTAKPAAKVTKPAKQKKKPKMSAAGRAAIVAAQKKRWAKVQAEKAKA